MEYLIENCNVFVFDNETYLVSNNKLLKMVDGKPLSIDVVTDIKSIDCSDKLLVLVGDSCFVSKSVDNPEWKKNWIVKKELIDVFVFNNDIFIIVKEPDDVYKMKAFVKGKIHNCSLLLEGYCVSLVKKTEKGLLLKQTKYQNLNTKSSLSVPGKIDFIYHYSYKEKNNNFEEDDFLLEDVFLSSKFCLHGSNHTVSIFDDYESIVDKNEKTIDEFLEIDYNKLLPPTMSNNINSNISNNQIGQGNIMEIFND